ncbi:diaminopropionate ammonia-lyase (plasmid) [Aminobacter sp. SR38]|jgi:diaminopropionate ammonia-lyase|uniref:diaminopropionate ammonia-lyase n=1 Tax=Aminobacter sp. SR38 TaxID=2774562 RepID=UPI00177AEE1C|nr:diaminopropionate ammonia-lyase [Aminobacter sp. SR38]QOF75083.1 diaminopropionate ammonia-lyase [Aminobacter sp. SR38]
MPSHAHFRANLPMGRAFCAFPDRPLALLAKCPVHGATPLGSVEGLAREFRVGGIFVKNEAARMRLGSFKALGGAFAVAQMICEASGASCPMLAREHAKSMIFITASAGNHGLSVAAGARIFGARAVVLLPETAPSGFAERIAAAGAEVIEGGSYDDCVRDAIRIADDNGWLHLSDGSWPGYVDRPALVMEGYTVLADECRSVFEKSGAWPTHVFLQAGVGGLAAAVAANIREVWPQQPQIIVVEPDRAACLRDSIIAGKLVAGAGPVSNMGRLDCKNASLIAYESLRGDADVFVTITDEAAEAAAARLAHHGFATTPSGAAGLAGLAECAPGAESRSLIIVSEGPEHG